MKVLVNGSPSWWIEPKDYPTTFHEWWDNQPFHSYTLPTEQAYYYCNPWDVLCDLHYDLAWIADNLGLDLLWKITVYTTNKVVTGFQDEFSILWDFPLI